MAAQRKSAIKKSAVKTRAAGKKAPAKPAAKTAAKMPTFSKAPPKLVQLFEEALAGIPQAQTRQMFGYPAAFVNGHMFAGLFQDNFLLRLPDAEREAFMQQEGGHVFEPMPGRPMREYVAVPPPVLKAARLDIWLAKSLAYAQSLPPKAPKAKRK